MSSSHQSFSTVKGAAVREAVAVVGVVGTTLGAGATLGAGSALDACVASGAVAVTEGRTGGAASAYGSSVPFGAVRAALDVALSVAAAVALGATAPLVAFVVSALAIVAAAVGWPPPDCGGGAIPAFIVAVNPLGPDAAAPAPSPSGARSPHTAIVTTAIPKTPPPHTSPSRPRAFDRPALEAAASRSITLGGRCEGSSLRDADAAIEAPVAESSLRDTAKAAASAPTVAASISARSRRSVGCLRGSIFASTRTRVCVSCGTRPGRRRVGCTYTAAASVSATIASPCRSGSTTTGSGAAGSGSARTASMRCSASSNEASPSAAWIFASAGLIARGGSSPFGSTPFGLSLMRFLARFSTPRRSVDHFSIVPPVGGADRDRRRVLR